MEASVTYTNSTPNAPAPGLPSHVALTHDEPSRDSARAHAQVQVGAERQLGTLMDIPPRTHAASRTGRLRAQSQVDAGAAGPAARQAGRLAPRRQAGARCGAHQARKDDRWASPLALCGKSAERLPRSPGPTQAARGWNSCWTRTPRSSRSAHSQVQTDRAAAASAMPACARSRVRRPGPEEGGARQPACRRHRPRQVAPAPRPHHHRPPSFRSLADAAWSLGCTAELSACS
jgi:hypothetical protein